MESTTPTDVGGVGAGVVVPVRIIRKNPAVLDHASALDGAAVLDRASALLGG